ncbi:MAG TPA: flagellar FlbD family protein [Bryobacteraceae bacterium]|nr:flagellar FlbD family protein [Bryobacteraceae bacterium]
MIHLTRLNRLPLVLNADLIESIEVTPDTVIALTTGQKLVVLEPAEEVVARVLEFRRAVYRGSLLCPLIQQAPDAAPPPATDSNHGTYARDNRSRT